VATPRIEGLGHIDLTVTDGERSARWWHEVLGFELVVEVEQPAFHVWGMLHRSGVYVGLMTHVGTIGAAFDERAVGLDHLALNVADRSALEAWAKHLDDLGVPHSGIKEENGGPLITLRDPDNIQLELHAYDPDNVVL
jgi:catechol 2,3-dioxygenase-like lactoylglutathione lyase family enzyme